MQENTTTQRALWWLFCIQLLSMGALEMSGPFWPVYLRQLGNLSPSETSLFGGIAYAGPMLAAMLTTPLWGRMGDRYGHKSMLIRALFALAATQLWAALAGSVTSVLFARLVQGAFAGFIAAAQAYGIGLSAGKNAASERASLIAKLQTATAIGSFVGPMLGGLLYEYANFKVVNVVATVLCLFCLLVTFLCLPTQVPALKKSAQKLSSSTKKTVSGLSPIWVGLLLAIVLIQAGKMMPQTFFALYVYSVLDAPAWLTGLCYGVTALSLSISAPLWGRYFGSRSDAMVLRAVEVMTWCCAVTLVLQALVVNLALFIVIRFIWGIWLGGLLPVFYTLLSRTSVSEIQGYVMGLGNSAAKAGALLGLVAGTLALTYFGLSQGFWFVAMTYLIAAIVIRFFRLYSPSISHTVFQSTP